MTEPKVVRRPARFSGPLPQSEWDKIYNLSDPNWHVPFVEDKDYIRADRWDTWAAVVIGIAVLIIIGLDGAWLMGWLPR